MSDVAAVQDHSPFERHTDHPAWDAGYSYGIGLAMTIISDDVPPGPRYEEEAKAVLRAVEGQCMACGSPSATRFPPRLPGRQAIWLCRADLDSFLEPTRPFPGEVLTPNPRDQDEPMWAAGLLAGLAMMTPMARPLPAADDGEARRAFWERLAGRVRHETCSVCPGLILTWGGGTYKGGVKVCYRCKEHLRERRALQAWSAPPDPK